MQNVKPVFNWANDEWRKGGKSLILGESPALYDSLNRKHEKLFQIYKGQKSADWSEDEINLAASLSDFGTCPSDIANGMIENIAFQWETDSMIANSMIPLLAPFITDSDFATTVSKNAEIENLHSLTYSEIVKLAIPNPEKVFERVMYNQKVKSRGNVVSGRLERLKWYGAKYTLSEIDNNQKLYDEVFLGLVALFCLERLQFMASFAHTFAIVEQGWFQGIGKLVQKIMQDEYYYHAPTIKYVLKHEITTSRGMLTWVNHMETIKELVDTILKSEYDWNDHIFTICKIPSVTEDLMNKWVDFNAQDIYNTLMLEQPFKKVEINPLPYMSYWLDLNKFQNANQEGDNNNYSLNSFVNDIDPTKIFGYY